jgi:hypothetical protein
MTFISYQCSLTQGATFIAVPSEVYAFGSMYMISGISAAVVSHDERKKMNKKR